MERTTSKIQQLYGYLVCIIAIITLLISTAALVNAIFEVTRPASVQMYGERETFDAYRLTQIERAANAREKSGRDIAIPSDAELRRSYDEQQRTRNDYAKWSATKSIVSSILMLILATVLFFIHWKWLRGVARNELAA